MVRNLSGNQVTQQIPLHCSLSAPRQPFLQYLHNALTLSSHSQ
uniref:Uncharacterized protein n=1 Tax=Arundo donax TaxID=35708 RepID=A0A0A9F3M0_ARUDO